MSAPLADVDPDIAELLGKELGRQRDTLEMIASENFVPRAVLQAQGSVLTNKYAEGLPGRRYYGGCEYVDVVENIARDRAKALFGADFANVQPHSGAQANAAVLHALMSPGERLLGLDLANGGHLTHGMKLNFSGKLYENAFYGVDADHAPDRHGRGARPGAGIPPEGDRRRLVGLPADPRLRGVPVDRRRGRRQAVGGHGALRRPGRRRAAPVAGAARRRRVHHRAQDARWRPRPGMIVGKQEYAKAINSAVFPGQQGGPLMHVIAAKAVALKIAGTPEFAERQQRTLSGARILAERLLAADVAKAGVSVVSGGTDVHLVLVDLRNSPLDGQAAEDLLHEVGITVNRNAVPNDPRPPMVTSGLRIGTPALATRGFGDAEFTEVADIIATALAAGSAAGRVGAARPGDPAGQGVSALRGPRRLVAGRAATGLGEYRRHGRDFTKPVYAGYSYSHGTETCR